MNKVFILLIGMIFNITGCKKEAVYKWESQDTFKQFRFGKGIL